jgi:hypothetical protein
VRTTMFLGALAALGLTLTACQGRQPPAVSTATTPVALTATAPVALATAPVALATATVATSSCTMAGGKSAVSVLFNSRGEWKDAEKLASSTPRMQLSAAIAQMQRTHREFDALSVPECGKRAHRLLSDSMGASVDRMIAFMAQDSQGELDNLTKETELLTQFLAEVRRLEPSLPR